MFEQLVRRFSVGNNVNFIKQGTYRGRLRSARGKFLNVELRLDLDNNIVSADFFLPNAERQNDNFQDTYNCSMQAELKQHGEVLEVDSPQFIFDGQRLACSGEKIKLNVQTSKAITIECVIPEANPEEYTGSLSFKSKYFRVLKIEVDKLQGCPWPPKFSTKKIIGKDKQPPEIEKPPIYISIEESFRRAGIDASVKLSNRALKSTIAKQRTNRPGEKEEIRWDVRELHEMMQAHSSRPPDVREWWVYLLIVNLFDGGIDIDQSGKPVIKESNLAGLMFDTIIDPSFNPRPRQGAAIFSQTFTPFEEWLKNRQFLYTVVHELGHALNLPHSWEADINRPCSISFMNYASKFKSSGAGNYWHSFKYTFDQDELLHIHHGFYNEVIPGGSFTLGEWTPSSVFRAATLDKGQSNLSLIIQPSDRDSRFRLTEPVIVEVIVKNQSSQPIVIGNLSPTYRNLRLSIRKPNGVMEEYKPPLSKCSESQEILKPGAEKKQLVSLAVDVNGFTFDAPGEYKIVATLPDSQNNALVIAPEVTITIEPPNKDEEKIANILFNQDPLNQDVSLFLYMGGGNHLWKAKEIFMQIAHEYPDYPIATHSNLVLGLNELAGQKRVTQTPDKSEPEKALEYLEKVKDLPTINNKRLKGTKQICRQFSGT